MCVIMTKVWRGWFIGINKVFWYLCNQTVISSASNQCVYLCVYTLNGCTQCLLVLPHIPCVSSNQCIHLSCLVCASNALVLPHIIPFDVEEDVNTGDSVQLNCHVSKGDKPLKITWNFHGEELSSHMGITTTKIGDRSSILTIVSVMAAHSGNYTCTAQNAAGTVSYTAVVHVNGTNMPILSPSFFLDTNNICNWYSIVITIEPTIHPS